MASHTVALVPGDGIGPETSAAMQRVVEASGADIVWDVAEAGAHLVEEHGTPLPASTIEAVKRNKVAIKGPVATPVGTGFRSVNVALRRELGLYACLRPVLSIPGAGGRYDGVDIVIVRENSEDLYAGIEFEEGSEGARKLIALCEEEGAGA
ncbi:MAG: isocitrate/isopropylmalate family dehydrogenase, partial [Eggerthella lenta]|nr:isocitrate/isopropylmalate family dehydrogenase [Eggerthella lenta]